MMECTNIRASGLKWACNSSRAGPLGLFIRLVSTHTHPRLNLQGIDKKWQRQWEQIAPAGSAPAHAQTGKPKAFVVPMFPYPSGTLHMGHLRVYTIADVLARFKHMQGHHVIHPMAWDAFGLPAENAAIERGVHPETWTKQNIVKMKEQLMEMNGSWDWSREFMTCDPNFYKQTQQVFLLLHEHGLAYQAESVVNYDPVDKTVLANEQVDSNGCSWRSGARVERKRLKQWFLRITAFKEALLEDLDILAKDGRWPERVISMQKNWLGKSKGARVRFGISIQQKTGVHTSEVMAFTTRPDTLFGVQYLALGIDHPLVIKQAESSAELQAFLAAAPSLPPDTKAGYLLKGTHASNPLRYLDKTPDAVKEPLPVFAAPYVIGDYGYGAVMGVPGHDSRDHSFWKENCGTAGIRKVVSRSQSPEDSLGDGCFTERGVLTALCGDFVGLSSSDASDEIIKRLNDFDNELGQFVESWKMRDWLISRQRYWGTPIPIIHCDACGAVPVKEEELPVKLPKLDGASFEGKGGNPLEKASEWVNTECPSCGSMAKRDTDTMDTFVDSSWYFARFLDPRNAMAPFSPRAADAALPVDIYVGGVEHAILHLLYARFISKFLATTPLWPSGGGPLNKGEPFKQLITQGMVHGKTYSDPTTGRFLKPSEVDINDRARPKIILPNGDRIPANVSYEKMSKSKHNGIDPKVCIAKYGADATRAHILFSAPVSEILEWDETRIVGIQRWFGKVWRVVLEIKGQFHNPHSDVSAAKSHDNSLAPTSPVAKPATTTATTKHDSASPPRAITIDVVVSKPPHTLPSISQADIRLWSTVQHTIRDVTNSLNSVYGMNTVVSSLMELTNLIHAAAIPNPKQDQHETAKPALAIQYHTLSTLLRLLAPIAPAFASEAWQILHTHSSRKDKHDIFSTPYPTPDEHMPHAAGNEALTCAVQVNGKLKFARTLDPGPPAELRVKGREEDLRGWLMERLVENEEGRKWLVERFDVARAKKCFVINGGKVINFVL